MLKELLTSALHPKELRALINLKSTQVGADTPYPAYSMSEIATLENHEFCYAILHKVSRSFAFVIQQLPEEMRDAICVFYLVLRGLDSIEDDMSIPVELKKQLLQSFHKYNYQPGWQFHDLKAQSEGYKMLLERYHHVIHTFLDLDPSYQRVISDICRDMGQGMSDFVSRPIRSVDEYNLYCHHVAGLVGIGLSRIFARSGLERDCIGEEDSLANSMGLFLQKTNIIRDIREDLLEERTFWPLDVCEQYVGGTEELLYQPNLTSSVQCLNHLVTEALTHVPDCLTYLSMIRHPQVFRFCAIPQVMAIATLKVVYNNPDVFRKNVKIRKGLTARFIVSTNSIGDVKQVFNKMLVDIGEKVPAGDPNGERTLSLVGDLANKIRKGEFGYKAYGEHPNPPHESV